jgi:gluconolactonase
VLWGLLISPLTMFAQDMPLTQVLVDGEDWQLVGEGYQFTEGPATDREGNVFFVDVPASQIWKVSVSGQVTLFAKETGKASGLMFGPEGRLYACAGETKQVVWYDAAAKPHVVAEGIAGNDLAVDRHGGVYVTDLGGRKVWYVSPQGEKRVVTEGFAPNGLTLWQDGGTLAVADWDQPHLWAFRVESDGGLKFGAPYYGPVPIPVNQAKPGSDGMTVDDDGRLYVCTHAGLLMFDPTGRLGGAIAKPQEKFLSNVKFGGPQFDTLFVTCSDKVYKRKTKVVGTPHALWVSKPAGK